jgi:hypothetical protein
VFPDEPYKLLTYPVSLGLGFSTGSLLAALIFSFQPAYWLIGGAIGMTHAFLHTYIIRQEVQRAYQKMTEGSVYHDKNFTL